MPALPRNILYIHSHDTGRYVAPYGHVLDTPNYQRFAEQGVLFRHAHCANPTCSPSRASLLTGRYAHANGMMGLAHRGGSITNPEQLLPNFLINHGYETVLAGVQHIASGDDMRSHGYTRDLARDDKQVGSHSINTDENRARLAADFLRDHHPSASPFFLDIGFHTTHRTGSVSGDRPETPPLSWHNGKDSPMGDPRYVAVPPCLPDTPEVRRDFADYAIAVRNLDRYLGIVLDALDKSGLSESTLVILTTDHGIAFPRMKCNLTAHGTGVLLMMRGPSVTHSAGFTGGRVFQGLVSHVDVFPTLCDAIGLNQPDWLQGTSLSPMLDGGDDTVAIREEVFAEVNYHAAREPMRSVRTPRYSYIRHLEPQPETVRTNIDDAITKTQLHDAGLMGTAQPEEQLFDLWMDPQEVYDLSTHPSYSDTLNNLRERLDRWMRDTADPSLQGPLCSPGMMLNPIDAYSPAASAMHVDS